MNDIASNELVVLPAGSALDVFTTPNAIDPLLAKVRGEIDAFKGDVKTAAGRKAIASMAYRVARAKTYLDDAGKALADEQKKIPKKIDECRKRIRDTLDAWKDEVRAPLTAWEDAEKARVDAHKANIALLSSMWQVDGLDAATIERRLAQAETFPVDESCEEFHDDYAAEKLAAITSLRTSLERRRAYEKEQAELAALRAADEERKRKEREEAIAKAAADKARQEAEAKADAERKAAEEAAARERSAAEKRELELRLQAEQAERRAAEAAAKAKRDAEEEARRQADEAAKREADKAHRGKINAAARDALMGLGLSQEQAEAVVTAVARREVPHISIAY